MTSAERIRPDKPSPSATTVTPLTPSRVPVHTVPPVEHRSLLTRYGAAVILSVAALLVTLAVSPYIQNVILIFFWPAVIGSAIIGGLGPGVLASILSVALADYFLIAPLKSFNVTDPTEIVPFAIFLLTSYIISSLMEMIQRERRKATEAALENARLATALDQQAMELEQQLEESQSLQEELELSAGELIERTAEAEAARHAAEAANLAKTQFLAVMSHELRTPLNAIAGYAELMRMGIRGPITPEQQADLDRIKHSQRNLLSLINDVLNYAKLEAGYIEFDTQPVLLHTFLDDIESLVTPQLQGKGLSYEYERCDDKLTVLADPEKMRQIVLNLVSNAIKFTPSGGTISVECDADDGKVRIRVQDTGVGIPDDKIGAIFEPFVQLDRKLTSANEGTGLGLAISRDLARGMKGDLSVESKVGEGSVFSLELPIVGQLASSRFETPLSD